MKWDGLLRKWDGPLKEVGRTPKLGSPSHFCYFASGGNAGASPGAAVK